MRVIGYIEHPVYKISVFSWSEKYIVKIEAGFFEQSYKFRYDEFSNWEELKLVFDEVMIEAIRKTFMQMGKDMKEARISYGNKPRKV
ncbi:MAG: hypothetical protein H7Y00_08515 [Fimbriimonadaceae bacterium]|nr:hypothetical protein [Chitinophagales bacterium]